MADSDRQDRARNGTTPGPVPRSAFRHRLRLHLPSTKTGLRLGVSRTMRLVADCGCPPDLKTDVEIALREALANALTHGNGWRRGSRVFLRCYASPGEGSVILVRDEGSGFDPDSVPDPRDVERLELDHGRGMLLMRALMDQVVYRRGGSEVLLYKAWPS